MSKATNIGKTRFAPFCKKNHIVKLTIPNYMLETEVNVNFTFLMFAIKHAISKYIHENMCLFKLYNLFPTRGRSVSNCRAQSFYQYSNVYLKSNED